MGATATKIAIPEEMVIPDPVRFEAVTAVLSDQGRSWFLSEILGSLSEAQAWNDLRPVQATIDAWWHSSLFAMHPMIEEAVARAAMASQDPDERRYTAAEVAEFLGV
jgi:hypothetical protein